MDRDTWLRECFPEWGTYLNKQIEVEKVKKGKLGLWWFGACSFYVKKPKDANLLIDTYSGRVRTTDFYERPLLPTIKN